MSTFPAFTVFDVETTGLDPYRGHKIVEIAGVRVENGRVHDDNPFVELVNPERPIPPDAGRINPFRDEDVREAPTIDQVLPRFLDFAAGSILVAHNAEFDMSFLKAEKQCCWGYVDLPECLCTMRLSQSLFPHEFRHNLDTLSQRLSLQMPEARHRALPDVLLTANALLKMMEQGSIASLEELRKRAGVKKLVA